VTGGVALPVWFASFLQEKAERFALLIEALSGAAIAHQSFESAAGSFIIAHPRSNTTDAHYRAKVFTAHYDRVPGTPGALDNSAACLQLMEYLAEGRGAFNTTVVFTDREELSGRDATEQGSYALGKAFSSLGLGRPLVFTFDVTGRGDALVISQAAQALRSEGGAMARLAAELDTVAAEASRSLSGRMPLYRARVPFGEDLGFLRAGVPALAFTVLPRAEAEELAGADGLPPWASPTHPKHKKPATWRLLHSAQDLPELYTASAFALMDKALNALGALRVRALVS
jgi:hypothetical protein